MKIFEYGSYKKFLWDEIESMRKPGIMTKLAAEAGCDRTYLSQVLSGKAQLTPDQALNLADALSLKDNESDFFLLLVLKERSSSLSARRKLESRLEQARSEALSLTQKIKSTGRANELKKQDQILYYSSWKFSAVHTLTSITAFQEIGPIAQHLGLSERETKNILEDLERIKLVTRKGSRYQHSGTQIHLSAESPLITMNHSNWRLRALEAVTSKQGLHYTSAFTISKEHIPQLKAQLLDYIETQRNTISKSGTDEAFSFCCDFFPV